MGWTSSALDRWFRCYVDRSQLVWGPWVGWGFRTRPRSRSNPCVATRSGAARQRFGGAWRR
ncbi:hypothetical protein BGZ61DRAFT_445216 [Ilyonectria robusta]|uniref:uncharacterized protein n=1 Tax=Ilyonectria robusta TaxID=1079257 RepID=UPI001E8DAD1F|nr:uncharacterized protein BGZ61DRAFT_445216 [Ilyonectria robusta]KAH8733757.1 hypothetical protein BGZ61DRAFT_445216 [Ilyonectria robusta]